VLDAGGQYCHLITRKIRELGVYAEVRPSETPAAELVSARGIIISGGRAASTIPIAPAVDPAIFSQGQAVLGICYGHQLMAHLLGGHVSKGEKGEFGLATLDLDSTTDPLFSGLSGQQQIWMSHRDVVAGVPDGFPWSDGRLPVRRRRWQPRREICTACSFIPRWSTPPAARNCWPISFFGSVVARKTGTPATARPSLSRRSAIAWAPATCFSS